MPSGDEWFLTRDADLALLIDCAEAVCDAWSEAVVEDTAAGEFAHSVDALLPTEESELCIYRDLQAAWRWQCGGPPSAVRNSMVQVSLGPQGLRLIADDWKDASLASVVERIGRMPRGNFRASPFTHNLEAS